MQTPTEQQRLWLREFELNGFVVLRGFLPADLVSAMHTELLPLLVAERAKADVDGFARGRGAGRLALHIGPYADLMRGALADDAYRRNPVIESLLDGIFDPGGWQRGWTVVEAAWKGSTHMDWHSDQKPEDTPDMQASARSHRVAYNIPLVPFTAETGAMEILPGSHHLRRDFGSVDDIANIYPHRLELELGDVVLRDGNGIHRGTPNLTDEVRPMLDQTYKRKAKQD